MPSTGLIVERTLKALIIELSKTSKEKRTVF
jgi:hypothetical protein